MNTTFFQSHWPRWQGKFIGVRLEIAQIRDEPDQVRAEQRLHKAHELQEKWEIGYICPAFVIVSPDDQRVIDSYFGAELPEHKRTFAKFLEDGWGAWRRLHLNNRP